MSRGSSLIIRHVTLEMAYCAISYLYKAQFFETFLYFCDSTICRFKSNICPICHGLLVNQYITCAGNEINELLVLSHHSLAAFMAGSQHRKFLTNSVKTRNYSRAWSSTSTEKHGYGCKFIGNHRSCGVHGKLTWDC